MAVKKSMKPIPPTLRGKKRYVKFSLLSGARLREGEVNSAITSVFSSLFGSRGIAEQRLWLIKWFPEYGEGILRCSLPEEESVKAGLLFIQKVGSENVIPTIVKVSGSVRKLKA